MKKLLLITLLLCSMTISCNNTNFNKIKKGMKTTEVITLVGEPYSKKDMFICTWWLYNDHQKHIIVVDKDSITNITTEKEFEEGIKDAFKSILK